jgi:hypothetical protein
VPMHGRTRKAHAIFNCECSEVGADRRVDSVEPRRRRVGGPERWLRGRRVERKTEQRVQGDLADRLRKPLHVGDALAIPKDGAPAARSRPATGPARRRRPSARRRSVPRSPSGPSEPGTQRVRENPRRRAPAHQAGGRVAGGAPQQPRPPMHEPRLERERLRHSVPKTSRRSRGKGRNSARQARGPS